MVEITDQELTKLQNTFDFILSSLADQQSEEGQKVKELIVEAQQIVIGKLDKNKTMTMGGSVIQKTRALFSMFHLDLGPKYEYEYQYEPELIGASKLVSDWKAKKNKQLFEMFHITR